MVGAQMQARGASVRQVARQLGVTEGALKVVRVILPAGHQSTKVLKAGKQPFDFPAASAATQRSAILRLCASFPRCGAINSMLRSWRSLASRVSSTSVTSCGEALAILIPIGRPWPSTIVMIFVPLPRLDLPTMEPPSWPLRRCRQWKTPSGRCRLVPGGHARALVARSRACRREPTIETGNDTCDAVDTGRADHSVGRPYAESTESRSERRADHATAVRVHLRGSRLRQHRCDHRPLSVAQVPRSPSASKETEVFLT
jgi:hypothetical protein